VMGTRIQSYEDLEVYQKLCELHLEVNEMTFTFPKFDRRVPPNPRPSGRSQGVQYKGNTMPESSAL